MIGAFDSVGIIDNIIFTGGDAASLLLQKGGFLKAIFPSTSRASRCTDRRS